MMPVLLALDPAAVTGFAVLGADGSLIDSGQESREDLIARLGPYRAIESVIVELPHYHSEARTPGNPNQLIRIAWNAADDVRRLVGPGAIVGAVWPHDWKGRIEKLLHHRRFQKDHCPPSWRARWDSAVKRLDERDAIALLQWAGTKAGIQCK